MQNVRTELLYHEIARRLLLSQTPEEICQSMSLEPKAFKRLTEKPDFRLLLDKLRDQAYRNVDDHIAHKTRTLTDRIAEAADESFDRLQALLRAETSAPSLITNIAQDFLDRAGYGKAAPTNQTVVNIGSLEASVLTDALRREREARERLEGREVPHLARPIQEKLDEQRSHPSGKSD